MTLGKLFVANLNWAPKTEVNLTVKDSEKNEIFKGIITLEEAMEKYDNFNVTYFYNDMILLEGGE